MPIEWYERNDTNSRQYKQGLKRARQNAKKAKGRDIENQAQVLKDVKRASNTVAPVRGRASEDPIASVTQLVGAEAMYKDEQAKAAQSAAALKKNQAAEIAAGKAKEDAKYQQFAGGIKDGMINGLPVTTDPRTGKVKYDINAIGEKFGMTPEQIQKAQSTTFADRKLSTKKTFDDLLQTGGKTQGGQNRNQADTAWQNAAKSLNAKEQVLNNIAQVDPYKAQIDLSKPDHLANLGKAGWMSVRGIDQEKRLDDNQGPTGLGKYGQYMPLAVGALATLINPVAGMAVQTGISAIQNDRAGGDWGDWAKQQGINTATSIAGNYLGGAIGGGWDAAKEGTSIVEGMKSGLSGVDMLSNFGAATQGLGPSALEVNMSPGDLSNAGSLSERANYAANLASGQFGGQGVIQNGTAFQDPTGEVGNVRHGELNEPSIEELRGPWAEQGTDTERFNATQAPINRVAEPSTPFEDLARMATGQGTLVDGQYQQIPGLSDPLSGIITPTGAAEIPLDSGGENYGQGFSPSKSDLLGLVTNLGLPVLTDLFGKNPAYDNDNSGGDYDNMDGLKDLYSEGGGEDPFSEQQMISAGIR